MKNDLISTLVIVMVLLASGCGPAQSAPNSGPPLTATPVILPTSNSAPSATPRSAFEDWANQPVLTRTPTLPPAPSPVEFIQSLTAGPDPFSLPTDLALDAQGNLYVVDSYNQRIVKFDANGTFLITWGSEGTGEGQFDFVDELGGFGGIAIDPQGNLYVADTHNSRIQKFTGDGKFLAQLGSRGQEDGQFLTPEGLLIDPQGNLYVSDFERHDIQKFDSNGEFLLKWGGKGTADGQFNSQDHLAMDADGNIYVADTFNHRIQKFDPEGHFLLKWGERGAADGQFHSPYSVAVDSQNRIYVAEYKGHRIQVFDSEQNLLLKWGSLGNGELEFREPVNVEVGQDGRIYIVDYQNNRIQVFRLVEN